MLFFCFNAICNNNYLRRRRRLCFDARQFCSNSACLKKYRELMCPTKTKWLSDGQADNKKNIQISLASNLPLNNDMTLILIFNMYVSIVDQVPASAPVYLISVFYSSASRLHSRDPHQLFELLCMQVKSISVAYFENLKDMCQAKADGSGQEILGDINTCEYRSDWGLVC